MTALSTLVGGGGGGANAWPSNSPHLFMVPNNMYNTQSHANYDMLCSFVPPSDVTIDSVDWFRSNTTTGNAYLGIYNAAGTLLTDCAVDSDATVGFHQVSTTNTDLAGGELYYWCLNTSATIAGVDSMSASDAELIARIVSMDTQQPDFSIIGTLPSTGQLFSGLIRKSRTNAAFLSSLTMSGWDASWGRYTTAGVTLV